MKKHLMQATTQREQDAPSVSLSTAADMLDLQALPT